MAKNCELCNKKISIFGKVFKISSYSSLCISCYEKMGLKIKEEELVKLEEGMRREEKRITLDKKKKQEEELVKLAEGRKREEKRITLEKKKKQEEGLIKLDERRKQEEKRITVEKKKKQEEELIKLERKKKQEEGLIRLKKKKIAVFINLINSISSIKLEGVKKQEEERIEAEEKREHKVVAFHDKNLEKIVREQISEPIDDILQVIEDDNKKFRYLDYGRTTSNIYSKIAINTKDNVVGENLIDANFDIENIIQNFESDENNTINIGAKEFDLNIEKILENWEVYHAVREIIANALDEQILTATMDIQIIKQNNIWHIIDYGRGINYHHLTQNENEEKLQNDKLIGRFGVGLKDALATLFRHNIGISISSRYGIITLKESSKIGFDDIITLHAKIEVPPNSNMVGTDFALVGCKDMDMDIAKSLFLKFDSASILEQTTYGQVIEKKEKTANIYINGVKVSEEPNFLFSYNITSLTKQIKKALNRERTNVGRVAYSERIKTILLACKQENVICKLVDDLQQYNSGLRHDELSWNDVAMYASKKVGDFKKNVVFITSYTAISTPSVIDEMKMKGLEPVVVPETLINKIDDYNQNAKEDSTPILTTNKFISDLAEKRKYTFLEIDKLYSAEREVYAKKDIILNLIGGKPYNVKEIKVSETIYESEIFAETVGLWDPAEGLIIIKRCQLKSIKNFAGTLVHECMHATSGSDDVSRGFESALTNIIGVIVSKSM